MTTLARAPLSLLALSVLALPFRQEPADPNARFGSPAPAKSAFTLAPRTLAGVPGTGERAVLSREKIWPVMSVPDRPAR